MKALAIIPARSGSKGLPDKNITDMGGKPLMYHTIKAALDSGCFDEVMVSTDSPRYADIARACGAHVPFLRSGEMASDNADSWDTVREVLAAYAKLDIRFDHVALLQPTSPLRGADDIRGIFKMLERPEVTNAISVTEVDHPIQWCFKMPEDGSMEEMAISPYSHMRRQDLERYYRENGAIYVIDAKKIMDRDYDLYADGCYGYIMDRERSIDIDTRMDLVIAKVYMDKKMTL